MGLRLKRQLLGLCLFLMVMSLGALTYFHLTLSAQDSLIRSDLAGRRTAELCAQQVQIFLSTSAEPDDLVGAFSSHRSSKLLDSLRSNHDLLQFDVFTLEGVRLLGTGMTHDDGLSLQAALHCLREQGEVYSEIWGHRNEKAEPLLTLQPFYRGRVVHHSYHPLKGEQGRLQGAVHLAVLLPKAPLRINMIVLGYCTVAAIFLVSSMLAIYLWAEFALDRPLRGLNASLEQLRALDPTGTRPDQLPQPNELSDAARALNHVTLDLVKYQRELQQKTVSLEQALENYRLLNEELEQKVSEKTLQMREFFSLVTHDLRIPLAAVAGYTELLSNPRAGSLSEKQVRYLQHIHQANGSAQDLVRNLLEAMKYEFGQPGLELEAFDLRVLVEEIQNQLSPEGKPIEIRAQADQDWTCRGDRARLGRVFSNLLSNALHHAGHAVVDLELNAQRIAITVSDSGPGIAPEDLPGLFEKFKGSEASGLGLGLYIVKRILADHGQEIHVHSQLGQGTRFQFELTRPERNPS
jgi:signal transduction histidine kinase